jgi:hypothetical protein
VANPARQSIPVRLTLGSRWDSYSAGETLWGAQATVEGRSIDLTAPARDVSVIALMKK